MFLRSRWAVPVFCLLAGTLGAVQAQTAAPQPATPAQGAAQQPDYTFHAESRVVLTDVTVTDRHGNPVHGLPASAFRIFDNNQPQAIASFEEHVTAPSAVMTASTAPGVYSNDYLLHLPPVLNIIILDVTNLEIVDQMYLNYQLMQFLKNLPAGQPVAIYLRAGPPCVQLQNFTSDRTLLEAAVRKAIPRFPPHDREYLSDLDTLNQLAVYLSQLPGRKNILWFSGGSTLFLREDATAFENSSAWRDLYDELEQERIAVYPIDARGLTIYGGPLLFSQHAVMEDVAHATGGHAYYSNNGLKEIAGHLLDSDGSFYTLTYSPHDFRFDNKWHKVKVKIEESSYNLSYRRGYFADGSIGTGQPEKPRTRLLTGGEKVEEPALRSTPIIFQARVLPASDPTLAALPPPSAALPLPPPKKGTVPFSIRYTLPVDAFALQTIDGKQRVIFRVAAFAFSREGSAGPRQADQISLSVNKESLRLNPHGSISVAQQLNLAKGDEFLSLVVWDTASGRLGMLQIPLEVAKPAKPHRGQ